jgi:hypothetical protein
LGYLSFPNLDVASRLFLINAQKNPDEEHLQDKTSKDDSKLLPHPELGVLALDMRDNDICHDYEQVKRKYGINTHTTSFAEDIKQDYMYLNKGINDLHICYTNCII